MELETMVPEGTPCFATESKHKIKLGKHLAISFFKYQFVNLKVHRNYAQYHCKNPQTKT